MEVNLVALAPGADGAQLVPSRASVPPTEAAKFEALLSQPVAPTATATDVAVVRDPSGVTLGDNILDGLQALGESYRTQSDAVERSLRLSPEKFGMLEALDVQMAFGKLNMKLDIYAKGVGKLGQTVGELLKMQ